MSDEDITPSDVPADPPTVMQGPMTWARMRQLNLEVSLFLSDHFYIFENRLLPNDVILLRTLERVMRDLQEVVEAMMTSKGVQQKPEARSNMISSLPRSPEPVCLKLVTQDASGLHF